MVNNSRKKPKPFKQMLAEAKLPEKTVPICLRGDLQAEFEESERKLAEAEKRPNDSLAGNGLRPIAERIEALREQMQDHTAEFVLRAMPRADWRAFIAKYPPRKDESGGIDPRDIIGVNTETFFDELVRRSVVEPELDDGDWTTLLAALTDRQFDKLSDAAWGLNRRDVDVPFSHAASRILGSASE